MHRFSLAGELVGCNGSMLQDTGSCSIDGDLARMLLLEQMHSDVKHLEVCSFSVLGPQAAAAGRVRDTHGTGLCAAASYGCEHTHQPTHRAPPAHPLPPFCCFCFRK